MRLSAISDLVINKFSGATITELASGMTNGVGEKRGNITYLTQRPSIDVFADASADISDARGRAIAYWEDEPALYIFNNDTIYKGGYGTSISTSPTAGTKKCRFFAVGSLLVLLDAENNQGFTISTSDTVTEITDGDFPPKFGTPVGIAHGGASLDTYLFVLGENGVIYHSDTNDASAWNALSFREAEREPDGGEYLGKHHDNIVAMGPSTVEFFYDAGNATGSVLNRRQDISYNIGCSSGESAHEIGDKIFWIGSESPGSLGIYVLEQFQVRKISNSTIDSFITQAVQREGYSAVGSGLSGQGHVYYTLTLYETPSDINPKITLVWDDTTRLWGEWDATINGLSKFPLMSWTKRAGASERFGEGILTNGDLISVNDNLVPADTLLGATYWVTGYTVSGYVQNTSASGTDIVMTSRLGIVDGGTNAWKYPIYYEVAGDETDSTQTLTLKWSNENSNSFNTGRSLDTSKYQKTTRCGRFRRRNHEVEYSGSDQLRIEAIEAEIQPGNH